MWHQGLPVSELPWSLLCVSAVSVANSVSVSVDFLVAVASSRSQRVLERVVCVPLWASSRSVFAGVTSRCLLLMRSSHGVFFGAHLFPEDCLTDFSVPCSKPRVSVLRDGRCLVLQLPGSSFASLVSRCFMNQPFRFSPSPPDCLLRFPDCLGSVRESVQIHFFTPAQQQCFRATVKFSPSSWVRFTYELYSLAGSVHIGIFGLLSVLRSACTLACCLQRHVSHVRNSFPCAQLRSRFSCSMCSLWNFPATPFFLVDVCVFLLCLLSSVRANLRRCPGPLPHSRPAQFRASDHGKNLVVVRQVTWRDTGRMAVLILRAPWQLQQRLGAARSGTCHLTR